MATARIRTDENYERFERQILANWNAFNQAVHDNLDRFIVAGAIDAAQLTAGFQPLASRFATSLVQVMIRGANISAEQASEQLGRTIVFNAAGAAAAAEFAELRRRVISILVEQQREALIEMQRLAQQVVPIRGVAEIRASITLTPRQVRAVANFRRMLQEGSGEALTRELRDHRFDPTLRRMAAGEITLTADQIDRMVLRYAERQQSWRARTIAATEAVRIANEADDLFYRQSIEDGEIDPTGVVRRWVTSKDEKVRPSHSALAGQVRGVDQPFVSGNGNTLRYPGDPRAPANDTINCRCWMVTTIREEAARVAPLVSAAA